MLVTRTSMFTGVTRTLDLPVTKEQFDAWARGVKIQDAFRNLTPDQREYIKTGTTQEEWDDMFAGEDDNNEDPGSVFNKD